MASNREEKVAENHKIFEFHEVEQDCNIASSSGTELKISYWKYLKRLPIDHLEANSSLTTQITNRKSKSSYYP